MNEDPSNYLYEVWAEVRKEINDTSVQVSGYYANNYRAPSWHDDIKLCFKEAAEGNERAQRYVAEFMKQRMLG